MPTPNTGIPYVPENTLDPAAGLNLSLNVIDALLQTRVIEIGRGAPPSTPADGDMYIVGSGAGDWSGEDDNLARYVAEGDFWQFYLAGSQVNVVLNAEDSVLYAYNGTSASAGWHPAVAGGGGGGGGSTPEGVQVTKSGTQSITTATNTAVSWDAAPVDESGFWSAGNPTRLTADVTGWYTFTASAEWAANATGRRLVFFRINGSTTLNGVSFAAITDVGIGTLQSLSMVRKLSAADYIEFIVRQDSGGSLNVTTTTQASMSRLSS